MNLGNMTFDHGILHLANWLGNVIMPTVAAAFIIIAILQFSKGQEFSHSMYGALACLLVSGLTRAFETFASQAAWNNPDLYWISIRTLIDWVANVILPVYAASQVAAMALRLGIFSLVHPTSGWLRHFVTAALCLMVSGLLRLAEFFVTQEPAESLRRESMALDVTPIYRNLRTRVTFFGLEAEDLFAILADCGRDEHLRQVSEPGDVWAADEYGAAVPGSHSECARSDAVQVRQAAWLFVGLGAVPHQASRVFGAGARP